MTTRILLVLSLLSAFALVAQAADISGQWVAQIPGRGGNTQETTFTFKVAGGALTGSITTPRGENPIADGKVSGDDVSFTQTMERGGNTMKFIYKGKVSGNEIKFTREREGGQATEFVAKKK